MLKGLPFFITINVEIVSTLVTGLLIYNVQPGSNKKEDLLMSKLEDTKSNLHERLDTLWAIIKRITNDLISAFNRDSNPLAGGIKDEVMHSLFVFPKLGKVKKLTAILKPFEPESEATITLLLSEIAELKNFLLEAKKNPNYAVLSNINEVASKIAGSINLLSRLGFVDLEIARTVAGYDEVKEWGWSPSRLLKELIQLDNDTMRVDGHKGKLPKSMEGDIRQWVDVFSYFPYSWKLLIQGRENIVGYWHFVALSPHDFALAAKGELLDSHITADKVINITTPGIYDIYIVSIALRKGFRTHTDKELLLKSFYKLIIEMAHNKIFIKHIITDAYTKEGERFFQKLGMEKLCKHKVHGTIYMRSLYPLRSEDRFYGCEDTIRELYESEFHSNQFH